MTAPDGITNDHLGELFSLPEGVTPAADLPYQESDFMPVLSTDTQSIGTSVWTTVSLELEGRTR